MKNKLLLSVLMLVIIVSSAACMNKNENGPITEPSDAQVETIIPDEAVNTDAESTPAPTAKPTDAPAKEPAKAPASAPETEPTKAPSVSAESVGNKMISSMSADTHNLELMPAEFYLDVYGVDASEYEEVLVYGTMMNVKSNEIILIKAKDAKGVETAKRVLNERRNTILKTWEKYLPDQYEIAKKSQIVSKGNFVALVCAEEGSKAVSAFNSYVK